MITIAVDAMGGDHAPKSEVMGAILAAEELGVRVILVGLTEVLRAELAAHPRAAKLPIEIHHASEVITMEDSAAKAVRSKKDSSLRVANRLVRDGIANGVVSAGNTGACMATSKMVLGTIPGVDRPALAMALPTGTGRPVVVLDVGANVDCTPEMLAQFAVMGEIYSRLIFHTARPRVGLLSIGEEEHKGNELTRAVSPLLKGLPINYLGNVEGRDIFNGEADVVICDGFVGNVVLKVSEGLVDVFKSMLKESLQANVARMMGAKLASGAFAEFKQKLDYSEYGGAPLLGLKGVSIICHGRSNPNAIKNAVRVAAEFANGRVSEKIESELEEQDSLPA